MNSVWLEWTAFALPLLEVQQLLHAAAWVAVLSWCSVRLLSDVLGRSAWLLCSSAWVLLLAWWGAPLLALGLAFQSPSLLTLCLCVTAAWSDMQRPERQLFSAPQAVQATPLVWGLLILLGWALLVDTWGHLPFDLYLWGFDQQALWWAWGLTGAWMLWASFQHTNTAAWHSRAASCLLAAVALFGFTHAPSGNAWDALLDPGLWLYAHVQLWRSVGLQRTRISHS